MVWRWSFAPGNDDGERGSTLHVLAAVDVDLGAIDV
jgi:hypothetical protein